MEKREKKPFHPNRGADTLFPCAGTCVIFFVRSLLLCADISCCCHVRRGRSVGLNRRLCYEVWCLFFALFFVGYRRCDTR